jgi:hypothetical protein
MGVPTFWAVPGQRVHRTHSRTVRVLRRDYVGDMAAGNHVLYNPSSQSS